MVMLMILAVLESFEILLLSLLLLTFSTIEKIWVYWKLEWEVGCQTCCLLRSKTYLNFRCVVRLFCSAQGSHLLTDRTCGVDFCKYDDHIKSRILCCFINPVLVARPLIFLLRVGGGGDYYSLLCTSAAWALRLRGSVNILRQISQKKLFSSVCIFICPFCSCWGEFPFQVPLYVWLPGARCQVEESSPFKLSICLVARCWCRSQSTCCWKWLLQVRWEPSPPGAGAAANPYSQAV